jgi:hypothetical protein
MTPQISFDDWLSEYKDEIMQIQDHSKSNLPTNPADIQNDLNWTTRHYPRAAELLADVEVYLTATRAAETLKIRTENLYADHTAPERKVAVEGRLTSISRTRDILAATCRALQERSYALMNQRKYEEAALRMTPRGND